MRVMLRVVYIVLSFLAYGCGTTATIVMADGREIEGEIVTSDSTTITVAAQEMWCPWSLAKAEADEVRASGSTDDHVCVWSVTDADRLELAPRSSAGGVDRVQILPTPDLEILLSRSRVAEVDHPGNVHLAVGTTLAATFILAGTAMLVSPAPETTPSPSGDFEISVPNELGAIAIMVMGASFIPVAVWGYFTWDDSKAAFHRRRDTRATATGLVPMALTTDGRHVEPGLGVAWVW